MIHTYRGTKEEDTLQWSDFWWMTHGPDQVVCYRQEKKNHLSTLEEKLLDHCDPPSDQLGLLSK
jgi:hypothetical protein